jgi:hypothetical protein
MLSANVVPKRPMLSGQRLDVIGPLQVAMQTMFTRLTDRIRATVLTAPTDLIILRAGAEAITAALHQRIRHPPTVHPPTRAHRPHPAVRLRSTRRPHRVLYQGFTHSPLQNPSRMLQRRPQSLLPLLHKGLRLPSLHHASARHEQARDAIQKHRNDWSSAFKPLCLLQATIRAISTVCLAQTRARPSGPTSAKKDCRRRDGWTHQHSRSLGLLCLNE